jgi:MFS family permease
MARDLRSESGENTPQPLHGGPSKYRMALRALRHRNYRLFFIGQLISLIGTWMQMIAQSWLVYRLTGSSLLLGTVGFASQFPVFLLAFIGGAVADRFNRHKLVIITQIAAMILAFVLSVLTIANVVQVWHIVVLAVLLGIVNALDMPVRQAFIVQLVDKEDLINAIALNSSVFNGARVIGPSIAGILIAAIGEGWCFFANGVSYIAVIAGLLLMKVKQEPRSARGVSGIRNLLEGFLYVRRTRPVRAMLLLVALLSMVGMPYSVLMPIFADRILHGGARGMGILMGMTGLGALAGAMSLAVRSGTKGLGKLAGYASAGFGIGLILFSVSRSFWLSALFLIPVGFSLIVQMGSTNTLIQTVVPDNLRGRVMALHVMMFMGMAPFGSFFAGAIAAKIGAPLAVASGAILCLIGAGVFLFRLPKLQLVTAGPIPAPGDEPESL